MRQFWYITCRMQRITLIRLLSSSQLKTILRSPAHFFAEHMSGKVNTSRLGQWHLVLRFMFHFLRQKFLTMKLQFRTNR